METKTSRERVEKFIKILQNSGFLVKTNWQKSLKMPGGDIFDIDHCTVHKDGKWVMLLIQIYPDNKGFDVFMEIKDNDIEKTIQTIETSVK